MQQRIDYYKQRDQTTASAKAPSEGDEEYHLIVNANSITTDLDAEIQTVHKVSLRGVCS